MNNLWSKNRMVLLKGFLASALTVIFALVILPLSIISLYPEKQILSPDKEVPPAETAPQKTASTINVYRHASGKTETVNFEDYVKGVVSGEMPGTFEMEALKAQAVAARTYSLSKIIRSGDGGNPDHPSAPICDDTHCQVYRDPEELKNLKSDAWMSSEWQRISKAVDNTKDQFMYYQGKLVEQPLFHSASGGKTENSEDVFVSALPYLRSVGSPYETEAPHQNDQASFSISDFAGKVKNAFGGKHFGNITQNNIKILRHSEGGKVEDIQVGNETLTGRNIRDSLGLSSANFSISFADNSIIFTTIGSGHGVGMSQWGANGMAKAGYDYKSILSHYYSGIEIK